MSKRPTARHLGIDLAQARSLGVNLDALGPPAPPMPGPEPEGDTIAEFVVQEKKKTPENKGASR